MTRGKFCQNFLTFLCCFFMFTDVYFKTNKMPSPTPNASTSIKVPDVGDANDQNGAIAEALNIHITVKKIYVVI